LHLKINATMVYVTHDQTEAMTLGDRIAVLNKRRLMQLDTPMHLYSNPANKFVAGFIGSPSMNFLKGIIQDKDGYYFAHESGVCLISLGPAIPEPVKNYVGRPVWIGIRPENVLICEENDISVPDCELNVMAFENMGNEQLIYLSLAGQTVIARRPPLGLIAAGKERGIRFMTDYIYYLDAANDRVINMLDHPGS